MKTHLPFKDVDIMGFNDIKKMWDKKGFPGKVTSENFDIGKVTIEADDWANPGQRLMIMTLHKLFAGSGFFGDKSQWIVEVKTKDYQSEAIEHFGCNSAGNQLAALDLTISRISAGRENKSTLEGYFFV